MAVATAASSSTFDPGSDDEWSPVLESDSQVPVVAPPANASVKPHPNVALAMTRSGHLLLADDHMYEQDTDNEDDDSAPGADLAAGVKTSITSPTNLLHPLPSQRKHTKRHPPPLHTQDAHSQTENKYGPFNKDKADELSTPTTPSTPTQPKLGARGMEYMRMDDSQPPAVAQASRHAPALGTRSKSMHDFTRKKRYAAVSMINSAATANGDVDVPAPSRKSKGAFFRSNRADPHPNGTVTSNKSALSQVTTDNEASASQSHPPSRGTSRAASPNPSPRVSGRRQTNFAVLDHIVNDDLSGEDTVVGLNDTASSHPESHRSSGSRSSRSSLYGSDSARKGDVTTSPTRKSRDSRHRHAQRTSCDVESESDVMDSLPSHPARSSAGAKRNVTFGRGKSIRKPKPKADLAADDFDDDVCDSPPMTRQSSCSKSQLQLPAVDTMSFLQCVVHCLKGDQAERKRKLRQRVPTTLWLSDGLDILRWRSTTKEGGVALDKIKSIKNYNSPEICLEYGTGEYIEFWFSSKESAAIWFNGVSCLVSPATVLKRGWNSSREAIVNYNPLEDSWKGTALASMERVTDFILLEPMGRGAFGEVLLAISDVDQKFYAVKRLEKDRLRRQQNSRKHKNLEVGDNKEIAIMKKLDHPNVVNMKAVVDDANLLYIVLEYMSMGAIPSKLEGGECMGEDEARDVFMDTLVGLEYLHSNRIVHRDLKPENLLRKGDGTVKISDFGAAKMYGYTVEDTAMGGQTVGTPAFTAPELCLSEHAPAGPDESYPADIWSLGVTLFCLVFGRLPFEGNSQFAMAKAVCTTPLKFPPKPQVSNDFKLLVRDILRKDPKERISIDEIWESGWVIDFLRAGTEENSARSNKSKAVQDVRKNFNSSRFSKNKLKLTENDLREAVLTITSDSIDQAGVGY